ncbi:hypothetical protein CC86DRAFT_370637 [Ophiobolus disseminans]|uniref:Uncharacterized protein n=1 Tax=Ophiobolus disseminans TaxID=1469910 RepID=A0A6A6ZYE7_9PLEO|nr:hypothetical protein CC86DRAFT_370637 [Ophiobolus disseminans]
MQTTRFTMPLPTKTYIPSSSETTALNLLRSSSAITILTAPDFGVFELGIPVPYLLPQGSVGHIIHTPQWWVGKSAVEIKAGPYAEPSDLKKAAASLKGLATKKSKKTCKTAKERDIENKLEEVLRRQEAGLPMCERDGDGEGSDEEDIEDDLEDFSEEVTSG